MSLPTSTTSQIAPRGPHVVVEDGEQERAHGAEDADEQEAREDLCICHLPAAIVTSSYKSVDWRDRRPGARGSGGRAAAAGWSAAACRARPRRPRPWPSRPRRPSRPSRRSASSPELWCRNIGKCGGAYGSRLAKSGGVSRADWRESETLRDSLKSGGVARARWRKRRRQVSTRCILTRKHGRRPHGRGGGRDRADRARGGGAGVRAGRGARGCVRAPSCVLCRIR